MDISTVRNRERLTPRIAPYWQKLGRGRFLGVRISKGSAPPIWQARFYDRATHPHRPWKSLGDFASLPPSERHGAAKKAAEAWFAQLTIGAARGQRTRLDVLLALVEQMRVELEALRDEDARRSANGAAGVRVRGAL